MGTKNTPGVFSGKQLQAIELLAAGDLKVTKIAEELNIGRRTLHQWRMRTDFMDAVIARARELVREALPELYSAAIREAKKGKHSYFKTLIEHVDRLEQMQRDISDHHIVFQWKIPNENSDS
jgi:predicted DNA-binding protein YlxM (UPF0122 family)